MEISCSSSRTGVFAAKKASYLPFVGASCTRALLSSRESTNLKSKLGENEPRSSTFIEFYELNCKNGQGTQGRLVPRRSTRVSSLLDHAERPS